MCSVKQELEGEVTKWVCSGWINFQEHRNTLSDVWDHVCMHFEKIQENVKAIQHEGIHGLLTQDPEFA